MTFTIIIKGDDELVVIYDKTVRRTTYGRGQVSNFTTEELFELDATKDGPPWLHKQAVGVPSLQALIDATPDEN